jgi:hypothetical protein
MYRAKLTCVTTLALSFIPEGNTGSGVNHSRFLHNQTITVETADIAAGVGQRNFIDLIGVQPDLALSAF